MVSFVAETWVSWKKFKRKLSSPLLVCAQWMVPLFTPQRFSGRPNFERALPSSPRSFLSPLSLPASLKRYHAGGEHEAKQTQKYIKHIEERERKKTFTFKVTFIIASSYSFYPSRSVRNKVCLSRGEEEGRSVLQWIHLQSSRVRVGCDVMWALVEDKIQDFSASLATTSVGECAWLKGRRENKIQKMLYI